MNFKAANKIIKYLLFAGLLFCTIKYGLKNNMSNINISIIITISLLLFVVVENGESLMLNKEKNNQNCQSICSMNEHLADIYDYNKIRDSLDNRMKKNANVSSENMSSEEGESNVQKNKKEITSHTNEYNEKEYTIPFKRRSEQITSNGSRARDDVLKSETQYNTVTYHTVPQIINEGSFEYGYSFLPPEKWYPTPPFPPVCVAEKQCPVCPVFTNGTDVNLKEWDSSRRITPPDEINVKYVEDKLNSGR
jgi:hypothetical protein